MSECEHNFYSRHKAYTLQMQWKAFSERKQQYFEAIINMTWLEELLKNQLITYQIALNNNENETLNTRLRKYK